MSEQELAHELFMWTAIRGPFIVILLILFIGIFGREK